MDSESQKLSILEVDEGNFETEVLRSGEPVLVAFGASWSHPCQVLKDVLKELATHCTGKVRVVRVNVDNNPDLGVLYEIEMIPTLLCFVGGQVRARVVGTATKEAILSKLQPVIART